MHYTKHVDLSKHDDLNKYDLNISRSNVLKKKEKNDLGSILFFPSLYWFNGSFSSPIPFLKYDELSKYIVKDYVTCSVHKHSVIVRKILKNEILYINMFNDKKVLSCLFYMNISYILKLVNIFTKIYSLSDEKEFVSLFENPTYQLFCYNEQNEIHLFDLKKNCSILSICEKKKNKITCLNFNFLYINDKNSLYNKLLNDVHEENVKMVDVDSTNSKILDKNKYCFELLQNAFIDGSYKKNSFKILKNVFYILIYGDEEGNLHLFVPEKKIKIKKKLRNNKICLIETNVKEYFKVKNVHDLLQTINNNYYIFIAFNDCIQVVHFYIFEIHYVIDISNDKLFCITTKFNSSWKNYLAFSTKNHVKVFNVNQKRESHVIGVAEADDQRDRSGSFSKNGLEKEEKSKIDDEDVQKAISRKVGRETIIDVASEAIRESDGEAYSHDDKERNSIYTNKEERELNLYVCIYFDSKDNIYISNKKGTIKVYNLNEQRTIFTIDINCKIIFYLIAFSINNKEYIYVYDSNKFYCLYLINKNQTIYKLFTISLWIYYILCFHNNLIFSLGNKNVYSLDIEKEKREFIKSVYINNINICTYLINHPKLPIIAFINKQLIFGFFFMNDTKRVVIPRVKENHNVISICWFQTKKDNFTHKDGGMIQDCPSSNDEKSNLHDYDCFENVNQEAAQIKKRKKEQRGKRGLKRQNKRDKRFEKYMQPGNNFDTYIAILNRSSFCLYNILNKETNQLNNELLNTLHQYKGKKYINSTFMDDRCYVFILYGKSLVVFDESLKFTSYIIKVEERVNKMYVKGDFLFVHSNTNIYFLPVEHIVVFFLKTNYHMNEDANSKKGLSKNDSSEENDGLYTNELHFIKLKLKQNFKIVLFDFYCTNDQIYVAIFSKKKQILVYRININQEMGRTGGESVEVDGELVAQFFNFYIFDHINKVGSISCIKFFYNSKKKKIYLTFGGLEQFLFLWDFFKYPFVQK